MSSGEGSSTPVETQAILEHILDAVAVVDRDWRCVYFNATFERMIGQGRGHMLGKTCWQLFPATVGTTFEEQFRRAMIQQVPVEFEAFYPRLSVWVEVRAFPTHERLTIFFRDITRQKQTEQALRDAAAQMQGVISTAVDGIIAIDERGTIEWLNPATLRIFGYTQEELIGKNINVLMPEPYHSEHDQYLSNYRNTGEAKIIGSGREVRGRRKDGSVFPIDLAISEVKLGHRRIFTGIVRDITCRKEAEHALVVAKEAAEASNMAKDRFLAVLSHELRTPLTPVLTTAQIMEADTTLSPEQQDAMSMIRRNAELEARLIDDLLDLTKISHGKLELDITTVDLHDRLRHVLGVCADDIAAKQIRVNVVTAAGKHQVPADPTRLQQILWNLLRNAVKFTPVGGSISIRTHNPDDDRVVVAVQDTGMGIEPELLPRLFDAFEQGGKGVTRQYGGLGLGLAIAKGLVDLHGGTLVAESEGLGKGATFTLTLRTTSTATSHRLAIGTDAQFRTLVAKQRVLLVEDHADTAKVMSGLLRSYGLKVTLARSFQDAVHALQGEPFDLLISDIGLPDGCGLDLMRHVAATTPMKAIALSGYGMQEDVRKSKEAGFLAHLTKPVDLKLLERVLKEILAAPAADRNPKSQ